MKTYEDIAIRALKTFVQTFIAVIGISKIPVGTPITVNEFTALPWVGAAIAGAVAAILSLAMNLTGSQAPTQAAQEAPVDVITVDPTTEVLDPITGAPEGSV